VKKKSQLEQAAAGGPLKPRGKKGGGESGTGEQEKGTRKNNGRKRTQKAEEAGPVQRNHNGNIQKTKKKQSKKRGRMARTKKRGKPNNRNRLERLKGS